jgi:hypothetical protein
MLVEEEDVPVLLLVEGGHLVVLLLRRLHLLHILHLLLWPQASVAKILQQHKHEDNICLQCKRVPIMMHLLIVVVGMRVTKIPHLQGLVNNLLVLHMFLMRLELVLMLLV